MNMIMDWIFTPHCECVNMFFDDIVVSLRIKVKTILVSVLAAYEELSMICPRRFSLFVFTSTNE